MSQPSRRSFLRGAGATIALPALESLGFQRHARAATAVSPPKRVVFLGIGWGVTQETWFPDPNQTGAGYTLPPGLAPLARQALARRQQHLVHQLDLAHVLPRVQ